jgi:hypothetical protein
MPFSARSWSAGTPRQCARLAQIGPGGGNAGGIAAALATVEKAWLAVPLLDAEAERLDDDTVPVRTHFFGDDPCQRRRRAFAVVRIAHADKDTTVRGNAQVRADLTPRVTQQGNRRGPVECFGAADADHQGARGTGGIPQEPAAGKTDLTAHALGSFMVPAARLMALRMRP